MQIDKILFITNKVQKSNSQFSFLCLDLSIYYNNIPNELNWLLQKAYDSSSLLLFHNLIVYQQ